MDALFQGKRILTSKHHHHLGRAAGAWPRGRPPTPWETSGQGRKHGCRGKDSWHEPDSETPSEPFFLERWDGFKSLSSVRNVNTFTFERDHLTSVEKRLGLGVRMDVVHKSEGDGHLDMEGHGRTCLEAIRREHSWAW